MRCAVLVAAGGAGWEADALRRLDGPDPAVTVLRRCVDLADLLATAHTGQGDVALVADGLPGLDADSVAGLHRCGVAVLAVVDEPGGAREERVRRLGVRRVLPVSALSRLRAEVAGVAAEDARGEGDADPTDDAETEMPAAHRTVAVWGPAGAPGRTTVAVALAAELARRREPTFLLDVDGYGGAVAQHLGILDEVSGLLAAARLANGGQLDHERLAATARQVAPSLRVLTGLPRSDRWPEVRDPAFDRVLDLASGLARHVVLDVGFCLEQDPQAAFGGTAPQRNAMTRIALERADEVIAVGAADPVGLGRLARGLVELTDAVPGCRPLVAVNRMRGSLGWEEADVERMLGDFLPGAAVHFLPEDRVSCDRALVAGRAPAELRDSGLRRAVAALADTVVGTPGHSPRRGWLRRRRRTAVPAVARAVRR